MASSCAAHLPGIQLTKEQDDILNTCKSPLSTGSSAKGQLVRVTAAAGTGKTTTLLCLALRAVEKGHRSITYLTFTKAAAMDGTRRLCEALDHSGLIAHGRVKIDARTLHSSASQALNQHRQAEDPSADFGNKVWSDKKLKQWISRTLNAEIESFLEPCFNELQRRRSSSSRNNSSSSSSSTNNSQGGAHQRVARDQVEFFLFKTLDQFCTKCMSRREFGKKNTFGRVYFPAKLFHESEQRGGKLGFHPRIYKNRVHWYADQACALWDKAAEEDIRTFNFIMKRAQLLSLKVPGTILLIDESQDMDGCQVHWVAEQVKFSKHVYVVGDAAQSIYGFRGAKSEYLMELPIDREQMLTDSFRFGPGIAEVSNLVLFAKENSDQTAEVYDHRKRCMKWKNWSPYRIKAGIDKPSVVTGEPLLPNWQNYKDRSEKITLIARNNKTLFEEALGLIGFAPVSEEDSIKAPPGNQKSNQERRSHIHTEDDEDFILLDEDDVVKNQRRSTSNEGTNSDAPSTETETETPPIPKIHINGFGESSGRKVWLKMFRLIGAVYDLFKLSVEKNQANPNGMMQLPKPLFPEFSGRDVTWCSFCEDVNRREMNRYTIPISVVNAYGHCTMAAVELFQREVVDKQYSASDSDIILTTCHAAKGMEWENVQVADDFIKLADYLVHNIKEKNPTFGFEPASKKMKTTQKWKFGFQAWGDDVNLAYVAFTRAKRTLSLPCCALNAIRDFDTILEWESCDDMSQDLPEIHGLTEHKIDVTPERMEEIRNSLVFKYREELK
ncbi:MAG: hypothetical protein SGBAC_013335, partial [Bacillariaceae sp.]